MKEDVLLLVVVRLARYKKFFSFKFKNQFFKNRQNVNSKNSSSNSGPPQQQQTLMTSSKNVGGSLIPSSISGQILIGQKGRVAFCLNAPLETRIARRFFLNFKIKNYFLIFQDSS